MKLFKCSLCFALGILLSGCAGSGKTVERSTGPLTVEEWKELPVEVKYEPETFARLKEANTKLKSDVVWDRFMRKVIVPRRKLDIPQDGH